MSSNNSIFNPIFEIKHYLFCSSVQLTLHLQPSLDAITLLIVHLPPMLRSQVYILMKAFVIHIFSV